MIDIVLSLFFGGVILFSWVIAFNAFISIALKYTRILCNIISGYLDDYTFIRIYGIPAIVKKDYVESLTTRLFNSTNIKEIVFLTKKYPKIMYLKNLQNPLSHNSYYYSIIVECETRIIRTLVEKCNLNVRKFHNGRSVLHTAIYSMKPREMLKFFITQFSVDVNVEDDFDMTILMHAIIKFDYNMVEFLITECKADVNKCNYKDRSPIHCAIVSKKYRIVELLVSHGATSRYLKLRDTPSIHLRTAVKNGLKIAHKKSYNSLAFLKDKVKEKGIVDIIHEFACPSFEEWMTQPKRCNFCDNLYEVLIFYGAVLAALCFDHIYNFYL